MELGDGSVGTVEELFDSLCEFMGIEKSQDPSTFITTSIGALEYSCVIARQCGVEKGSFMEAVENVWGRVEGEGTIRGEDEEGMGSDSPSP